MILEIATIRIKIIFEYPYDLNTDYMKRVIEMYEVKEDSDRYDFTLKTEKKAFLPSSIIPMENRNNTRYHETKNTFVFETESWISTVYWDRKLMTTSFFRTNNTICENDYFLFIRSLKLLVSLLVLERGGLPFHCSAVIGNNNKGILFSGKSGTGKTTSALNLYYNHGWGIYNDEYNIIMPNKGEYFVHATPFTSPAKFIYCSKGSAPVHKVFFLKKDTYNKIKDIDLHYKYLYILNGVYSFPTSKHFGILLMKTAEKIARNIAIQEISLNYKSDIVKIINTLL